MGSHVQQSKLSWTSTYNSSLRFTNAHIHPGVKEWGFDSASLHLWIEERFLCSQMWWVRWRVWAEGALWRAGWGEWPGGLGISPRTCTGWNTYLKWCQPLLPRLGNGLAQWDFHGTWNVPPSSLETWVGTCFYLISIALEAFHSDWDCLNILELF